MKRLVSVMVLTFCIAAFGFAQTKEIKPKGVYKKIEVTKHNSAIENLQSKKRKQESIDAILKSPHSYNPPVLFALSRELFQQGKKDDAAYWFYVAQLRARYDANLCLDNSAKQAVAVLNNAYGPEINKYAFQDIDKLEKTVERVVEFVKSNEETYDHRWINLHGMGAVMAGLSDEKEGTELSQPKDQWEAIKKQTVDDYYNGFVEHAKSQKK